MSSHDFIRKGEFSFCLPYFVPVKIPLSSLYHHHTVVAVIKQKYGTLFASQQEVEQHCIDLVNSGKLKLFVTSGDGEKEIPLTSTTTSSCAVSSVSTPSRREHEEEEDEKHDDNQQGFSVSIFEPLQTALFGSVHQKTAFRTRRFHLRVDTHYHEPPVLFDESLFMHDRAHDHDDGCLQPRAIKILAFLPLSRFSSSMVAAASSSGIIAVNKPQSIPVHSCGKYHKHTVEYLFMKQPPHQRRLQQDEDEKRKSSFYPCHRIDKGTSGVLLIGTDSDAARVVGEALMDKSEGEDEFRQSRKIKKVASLLEADSSSTSRVRVQKEYVARVHGKVNNRDEGHEGEDDGDDGGWFLVDRSIYESPSRKGYFCCLESEEAEQAAREFRRRQKVSNDEKVENEQVKEQESKEAKRARMKQMTENNKFVHNQQPCETEDGGGVKVDAKWAATFFRVLSYCDNTNTTLLQCRPVTGRTHQIRVHLAQVLKHSIVDDDVYESDGNSKTNKIRDNNSKTFALPGEAFPICTDCKTCRDILEKKLSLEEQFHSFGSPTMNLHSHRYYFQFADEVVGIEAPLPKWALS